ncbi:unnamed protein product [Effrenium voratum]|uniref:Alpha/beta hydrolase fold-3 domain-containing protein n=1 Tax=Effrenium voratum TaxID=2562239 RepID=A0AA36NF30_9DINO|nr:unnamed protein product [Effrenium voratum]CAJ1456836.1 unnamed protein product [Effrenium voratum]
MQSSGDLGNPWLDQLPGVFAGAFLRRQIEKHFVAMGGEVHTYQKGLNLHLLLPETRTNIKQGCVVFLHGGGFLGGAPSQFYPYAKAVSRQYGIPTACCEMSCVLTHPRAQVPFDTVEDARKCVRFLQDRSEELGLDREKIVLAGASSGGHTAAMAALGDEEPGLGLAGLLLFNPVLDLQFRERWQHRRWYTWLCSGLMRFRYGRELLEEHSPVFRVRQLPQPTLILHGTEDQLVPLEEVRSFQRGMECSGSDCKVITFPGEGHFFFNWRVSPANFSKCVGLLGDFLKQVGVLSS